MLYFAQLKIYAASQSVTATIPDDYNAKGESLQTLLAFHNGESVIRGDLLSRYTFGFQIIFPFLVAIFAGFLMFSLIGNNTLAQIRLILDDSNNITMFDFKGHTHKAKEAKHSQLNMRIYMTIICSYLFTVYVFILACLAAGSRTMVDEEIFHNPSLNLIHDSVPLHLEFGISYVLLIEDFIVLIVITFGGIVKLFCFEKLSWYFVLLGPAMCIVIHSYHILIGFIHTPHHATSVLVFYGLVIIFFMITLKTFYNAFSYLYTLIYTRCGVKQSETQTTSDTTTQSVTRVPTTETQIQSENTPGPTQTLETAVEVQTDPNETQPSTPAEIISVVTPALTRNESISLPSESKSPAEDKSSYPTCCRPGIYIPASQHCCKFFILSFIATVLALLLVFLVYLFVLVPINNAIDDAPNRIVTINQTILIIIGILITFKIFDSQKGKSFLDYLAKAKTSQLESNQVQDSSLRKEKKKEALTEWKKKSNEGKREDVAGTILNYYKKAEDSS